MFTNLSLTGTGIVVALVTWALGHTGLSLGDDQINLVIKDLFELAGVVMTLVGQIRRGDLHFGLIRK